MKVIICGAGQVGSTIARHFANEGISVTVIDSDPEQVRLVDESHDVRGVAGHASHPSTLQEAGAGNADMLIAVTRSDEVNMVACQVAYSLFAVKRRIARLRHTGYLEQDKAGLYAAEHLPIDTIISPEMEVAEGIANRLKTPGSFDMVPMAGGRLQLLGINVDVADCAIAGTPFADVERGASSGEMSILAAVRKGRSFVPAAADRIELGDDVYALARTGAVDEVMAAFGHRERAARRILVAGAGNVGRHLVRKILAGSHRAAVTIVERDRDRAESAAREFGGSVVVLRGDALDRDLLGEAHADTAEVVVAVTSDDETNIFGAALAKELGCRRAIVLVNKRSYQSLIPRLGIDVVVNPSAVTISTVLRHLRHASIKSVYTLREDVGEVVEADVPAGSRLLLRPVDQLGLPPGMKIGAMVRGDDVVIPRGGEQLQVGDRLVALVPYSYLRLTEALLGANSGRLV